MTVQITDITESPVIALGGTDGVGSMAPEGIAPAGGLGAATTDAAIAVTGIDAGVGAVGTPATKASISASSIASTGGLGTVQLNLKVWPTQGIPSAAVVGAPTAFISMNPDGIDAGTGDVGEPRISFVMYPDGVASAAVFGDVDTLATVFIIPGPVDPSNDFGDAVVTKKGWVFRTPVNTYQWRLFKEYEGISLLKESGTWSEVAHPDLERTRAADLYLAGGRDHVVSTSLKTELEGLGYTVTEEIVSTEEYLS